MDVANKKTRIAILLTFSILSFVVFLAKCLFSLDPDLGWHLRLGEEILKRGVQFKDTFSYTMAGFPFVDHEWLSNVIVYLIYHTNPILLAIFFAIFPTAALLIALPKKIKFVDVGVFLIAASLLLSFSGERIQVFSWVLVALLLSLFFNERLWQKFKLLVPLLVLIWANLHGGFAISIYLLAVFTFLRFISKKLTPADVLVFLASILATLANPYGIRLWGEIFAQIGDSSLRFEIIEWLPGIFFFDFSFLLLLAVTLALIYRYRKKLSVIEIGLYFALLALVISSVRHLPFFIIVTAIIAPKVLGFLYEEVGKSHEQKKRFIKTGTIFALYALAVFASKSLSIGFSTKTSEKNFYPAGAVKYFENHKINGEIFALYDWGGYLNWKFPQNHVFIDGRMPSWRWPDAPSKESKFAYGDYSKIIATNKNYQALLDKYNIEYVLWLPGDSRPMGFSGYSDGASFISNNEFLFRTNLINHLRNAGWKKVYEDEVSVLYQKS